MTELDRDRKIELASLLKERDRRVRENQLNAFVPYPYQKKFFKSSKDKKHRLLMAANRIGKCVIYQTLTSTPTGERTIGSLYEEGKSFDIMAWDGNKQVVAKAHAPFSKGMHDCYDIIFDDGSRLGAADHHRVLLKNGNYSFVEDLYDAYKTQQDTSPFPFCDELNVAHYLQTPPSLEGSYSLDSHQYDALLREKLGNALGFPLQQVDVHSNSFVYQLEDALASLSEYSHYQLQPHLSKQDLMSRSLNQFEDQCVEFVSPLFDKFSQWLFGQFQIFQQPSIAAFPQPQSSYVLNQHHTYKQDASYESSRALNTCGQHGFLESLKSLLSFCGTSSLPSSSSLSSLAFSSPMLLSGKRIVAVNPIGRKEVYDFEVEKFHNYIACDMVHHNSYAGAMEIAIHATGLYPKWWRGKRYTHAIKIIAGGVTTERARDIVQKELCGEPSDPTKFGTGALPKHTISHVVRRAGIPNALSAVFVKHVSGENSKITIQSYESGKEAWMGNNANIVWLDEEPPQDIYSQALRAMVDLDGDLMMTFTPENGVTEIVRRFTQEIAPHQYLQNATWDDAPHITKSVKEQMLASLPPHERDMRMKGLPMVGSGLVFSVPEDAITCDDFKIPDHWRRLSGIDFGYDHPTAWANMAYDPESDIIYITQAIKIERTIITEIASVLKKKGAGKIPVAWPHDGLKHDITSGKTISELYRFEGIKMLPEKFSNPPIMGAQEGSGGIGIEAGIAFMLDRMETGRFKVFKTCTEWFNEYRMYHRKNGKIVDRHDDLMAASRYVSLSLRFAVTVGDKFEAYIPKDLDFQDDIVCY